MLFIVGHIWVALSKHSFGLLSHSLSLAPTMFCTYILLYLLCSTPIHFCTSMPCTKLHFSTSARSLLFLFLLYYPLYALPPLMRGGIYFSTSANKTEEVYVRQTKLRRTTMLCLTVLGTTLTKFGTTS